MILDSSTQWSNRSCSQVSNTLTPSPAQVWIKTSQERPSNNILGARVLKQLICWNGSKDPQIELWLERTPAQNWTNNYQHLSPKSIWHKVKLLPPDVLWISFSCSLGWFTLKGSHNTKRITAKSQNDILHWPRNYGKESCTLSKSVTFLALSKSSFPFSKP